MAGCAKIGCRYYIADANRTALRVPAAKDKHYLVFFIKSDDDG
jgi:hypothetical protein